MRAEAREISHCDASYRGMVKQGFCYIYRVLHPERGTLKVLRQRNGVLEIGQFKLAHNQ